MDSDEDYIPEEDELEEEDDEILDDLDDVDDEAEYLTQHSVHYEAGSEEGMGCFKAISRNRGPMLPYMKASNCANCIRLIVKLSHTRQGQMMMPMMEMEGQRTYSMKPSTRSPSLKEWDSKGRAMPHPSSHTKFWLALSGQGNTLLVQQRARRKR